MKSGIITGGIAILILAVVAGNWIYGKNIAKKVDEQLKVKIDNSELPATISYASITVNPLFSRVEIKDFEVSDEKESVSLNCELVEFDISGKEALRLINDTTFEELNSLKVQLKGIKYGSSSQETPGVTIENVTVDFDGHLTKTDIENLHLIFPKEKQNLELSFSNLKVNSKITENNKSPLVELQKQFSTIDDGKCILSYNPDLKEISVKKLSLSSKVLSTSSTALLKYSGEGASDFKMISAKIKSDYNFEPKDVHWEDGDKSMDFSLSQLAFSSDFTMNFNKPILPEGTISFLTKGLRASYQGNDGNPVFALPIPGVSFNQIDLEKFSTNYKLRDNKLTISDTELKSSMIDASLEADVSIDKENTKNSKINNAKLVVSKLSPQLEEAVTNMEHQTGKELPRKDNIITIEITGTLGQPKIKGLEL